MNEKGKISMPRDKRKGGRKKYRDEVNEARK